MSGPARHDAPHSPEEVGGAPVSVRLGQVVPPEDPEDWRRPLTWLAAVGMLAAPIAALVWFAVAPPERATPAEPGTWLLAVLLAAGGVVTGTTQRGAWRAFAATVGTALFAAVATLAIAASITPQTPAGTPPAVSHAVAAAAGGLAGTVGAAPLMALFAGHPSRARLSAAPLAVAGAVAVFVVAQLMAPR